MVENKYLYRCFQLAKLAEGDVGSNPKVGCVIVYNSIVIGEGFHKKFGDAHAEVNAINNALAITHNAEELFIQSTLYVNLEPCAHFGKTPPCVDLIIKYKFKKVVIGCIDPFSEVSGKGIERLKNAGIEVEISELVKESIALNKKFVCYNTQKRPFVTLKWSKTADGYIGSAEKQISISNALSKVIGHKLRAEHDVILIGRKTAMLDNPTLNTRNFNGKNPIIALIDPELKTPNTLNIFNSNRLIIFNKHIDTRQENIIYSKIEFDNFPIGQILFQLYLMGHQSLLVEGGALTLTPFLEQQLWDEAYVFTNPELTLLTGIKAPCLPLYSTKYNCAIGNNTLEHFVA